jgi:hypothetical protein
LSERTTNWLAQAAGDGRERGLHRERDRALDLHGRQARAVREHGHLHRRDVGHSVDRQEARGGSPGDEHDREERDDDVTEAHRRLHDRREHRAT